MTGHTWMYFQHRQREAARLMVEVDGIPVCGFPDGGWCLPATPQEALAAARVLRRYRQSFERRERALLAAAERWFNPRMRL